MQARWAASAARAAPPAISLEQLMQQEEIEAQRLRSGVGGGTNIGAMGPVPGMPSGGVWGGPDAQREREVPYTNTHTHTHTHTRIIHTYIHTYIHTIYII
jgi:hypothetical protein